MKQPALALLLCASAIPVFAGLAGTLVSAADEQAWQGLLATPGLARASLLSLWTGLASTLISLGLAHLALACAGSSQRLHRLRLWTLPVLATPHLAIGIGLVLLLTPSGLFLRLLSPWATGFTQPPDWLTVQDPLAIALIAGLVVKETPFLVLALLGAMAQVDAERLTMQARVLGYGHWKAWFTGVAPLLQKQSRFAVAAVVVFGITNVEMALALGPTTPPTLSLLAWTWFTDADLALRSQAFACAVLLLAVTAAGAALIGLLFATGSAAWRRWATDGHRPSIAVGTQQVLRIPVAVVFALGFAAMFGLFLRSIGGAWRFPDVLPARPGFDAWIESAGSLGGPLGASLMIGFTATVLSVLLVLFVAEGLHDRPAARLRIGILLFLPLVLPQMSFLFGQQVLLIRLGLDGTWTGVLWTHLLFVLPYVWVVLAEARAHLHPGYRLVARTLGAGPLRTWMHAVLPQLARSILLALGLGFAVSIALYLPTLFAGGGRIVTVTTEAAVALGSGDLRSAAVYGFLQTLTPLAVLCLCMALSRYLFSNRRGLPA